jgi:hypothetical protein
VAESVLRGVSQIAFISLSLNISMDYGLTGE